MLSFFFIALLQTAAGEPAAPATAVPVAQESVLAAQDAAAQPGVDQPRQMRRERRCTEVEVTGRRLPQRVCHNVMVPVEDDQSAD